MQSTIQLDEVDKIIDGIGCDEKNIISILQGVQEHYRYLPKEVFPHIAKRLGVGDGCSALPRSTRISRSSQRGSSLSRYATEPPVMSDSRRLSWQGSGRSSDFPRPKKPPTT